MERAAFFSASPLKGFSLRDLLGACLLVAWGVALLWDPGAVRDNVAQSILYCLSSLTPSLFPFMVLASFGIRSRAGEVLGRLLEPITRHLFRLPTCCGPALVLGFLGGYPAGARCVSLLLEEGKITKAQGGRMLLFCINPGPAFVVTFLGYGLLGSLRVGWLLFIAATVAGLALGILSGLGKPLPEKGSFSGTPGSSPLTAAVSDASSAVVKMCGCILLFSGISALLHSCGVFQKAVSLLSATGLLTQTEAAVSLSFLLEITGGTGDAARLGAAPGFYAFGLGFAGLCVHLQVFAFFREFPGNRVTFFLFRLFHGGLAAVVFLLLQRTLPSPSLPAWAASAAPLAWGGTASTLAGGLSLLLMCLAFLVLSRQNPSLPQTNGYDIMRKTQSLVKKP